MIRLISDYMEQRLSIPQGGRIILDGNVLVMTKLKEVVIHDGYTDPDLLRKQEQLVEQAAEIERQLRFDSPPTEPIVEHSMLKFAYGDKWMDSEEYKKFLKIHDEWRKRVSKWEEQHYDKEHYVYQLRHEAARISPRVPPITKLVEVVYDARDVGKGFIKIPYLSETVSADLEKETECGRIETLLLFSIQFAKDRIIPSSSLLEEFNNEIQHQGKSKAQVVPSRKFGYEVLKDTVESFI
jgi:hypothetical protein